MDFQVVIVCYDVQFTAISRSAARMKRARAGRQVNDNPAYRGQHPGSDLEQLQPDPGHLCTSKRGAMQGGTAYVFHQHIRCGTEQNPELIGHELVTTGAISKESSPRRPVL